MDATFAFEGQRFVWNEAKAFDNFIKHGVGFEQACQVFFDPFVRMEDAGITSPGRRDWSYGGPEDLVRGPHVF